MATIGQRIKAIRLDRGMTQEQLAKELGTTKYAISKYELDKRQPRYEMVERMAEVFRTSTGAILGRGTRIKDMIIRWKSRKDARLEIDIDEDLLMQVQGVADADGLSLSDEVERLLREYLEIIYDEEIITEP